MIYTKDLLHEKDKILYHKKIEWHQQMLDMFYTHPPFIDGDDDYMLELIFSIDEQIVNIPDMDTKL